MKRTRSLSEFYRCPELPEITQSEVIVVGLEFEGIPRGTLIESLRRVLGQLLFSLLMTSSAQENVSTKLKNKLLSGTQSTN